MRTLLSLAILWLFISLPILQAQELQPLKGSWQIIQVDHIDPPSIEDLNYIGHKFHFLEDGKLLLQSDRGHYLTSFIQESDQLKYAGLSLDIALQEATQLKLIFIDEPTDRRLILQLEPTTVLEDAALNQLTINTLFETVEDFQLQGLYYGPHPQLKTNSYYRFYSDNTYIHMQADEAPEKMIHQFNKAYYPSQYLQNLDERISREDFLDGFAFIPQKDMGWWFPKDYFDEDETPIFIDLLLPTKTGWVLKETKWASKKKDQNVYLEPDQMPLFPGCAHLDSKAERDKCHQEKLLKFLYKRVTYPADARMSGTEGVAVINFIVETDGSISNLRIVRDVENGIGEEALRVVNLMIEEDIRWTPGMVDNVPVRVEFNVPLRFKLQ